MTGESRKNHSGPRVKDALTRNAVIRGLPGFQTISDLITTIQNIMLFNGNPCVWGGLPATNDPLYCSNRVMDLIYSPLASRVVPTINQYSSP